MEPRHKNCNCQFCNEELFHYTQFGRIPTDNHVRLHGIYTRRVLEAYLASRSRRRDERPKNPNT